MERLTIIAGVLAHDEGSPLIEWRHLAAALDHLEIPETEVEADFLNQLRKHRAAALAVEPAGLRLFLRSNEVPTPDLATGVQIPPLLLPGTVEHLLETPAGFAQGLRWWKQHTDREFPTHGLVRCNEENSNPIPLDGLICDRTLSLQHWRFINVGLDLSGLTVEGHCKLQNLDIDGELQLPYARIRMDLQVLHSRCRAISLLGSTIGGQFVSQDVVVEDACELVNAQVANDTIIQVVRPTGHLNFWGTHFGKDLFIEFKGSEAALRTRTQPQDDGTSIETRDRIVLKDASIGGRFICTTDTTSDTPIIGHLSAPGLQVGGECTLIGIFANNDIDLSSARMQATLIFKRVRCNKISMSGIAIGGEFKSHDAIAKDGCHLVNAKVANDTIIQVVHPTGHLNFWGTHFGKDLFIEFKGSEAALRTRTQPQNDGNSIETRDRVVLKDASIGGRFICTTDTTSDTPIIGHLSAPGLQVGGECTLIGILVNNDIDLSNARLQATLLFDRVRCNKISMSRITVGGEFISHNVVSEDGCHLVNAQVTNDTFIHVARPTGHLNFLGVSFGKDLVIEFKGSEAALRTRTQPQDDGTSIETQDQILLKNASIGGRFSCTTDTTSNIPIVGHLSAPGLQVGGECTLIGIRANNDIDLNSARLQATLKFDRVHCNKISMSGIMVGGECTFVGTLVNNEIDFNGSRIAGDLLLRNGIDVSNLTIRDAVTKNFYVGPGVHIRESIHAWFTVFEGDVVFLGKVEIGKEVNFGGAEALRFLMFPLPNAHCTIGTRLALSYMKVRHNISIGAAAIEEDVVLIGAHAERLEITSFPHPGKDDLSYQLTKARCILAENAEVTKRLYIAGCEITQNIDLSHCKVGGTLHVGGGKLIADKLTDHIIQNKDYFELDDNAIAAWIAACDSTDDRPAALAVRCNQLSLAEARCSAQVSLAGLEIDKVVVAPPLPEPPPAECARCQGTKFHPPMRPVLDDCERKSLRMGATIMLLLAVLMDAWLLWQFEMPEASSATILSHAAGPIFLLSGMLLNSDSKWRILSLPLPITITIANYNASGTQGAFFLLVLLFAAGTFTGKLLATALSLSRQAPDIDNEGEVGWQRLWAEAQFDDLRRMLRLALARPNSSNAQNCTWRNRLGEPRLNLSGLTAGELNFKSPIPTSANLNNIMAEDWSLNNSKEFRFEQILEWAHEFSRQNYVTIEGHLRNRGEIDNAERLYRTRRQLEQHRELKNPWRITLSLVHSLIGYGTRRTRMFALMIAWMMLSGVWFFVDHEQSFQISSAAWADVAQMQSCAIAPCLTAEELEHRVASMKLDRHDTLKRAKTASLLAIRYHVPILNADLVAHLQPYGPIMPVYTVSVWIANWILWSLLLASLLPSLVPKKE